MSVPTISVLMTLFNREEYVSSAIESVLSQTFGDFELIVCDDRSTDAGPDIARHYAVLDSRVHFVANAENIGDYPNRNRAASLATGTFIKYHDSDDLMYPHCLATMLAPMLAEPSATIGISLGRNFPGGPSPMLLSPRQAYQREFLGSGLFSGGPACGIFRRERFLELGAFPIRGVASDYVFWLNACATDNTLTLPGDLFWWRQHPGQEFQKPQARLEYAIVEGEAWRAIESPKCPLHADEKEAARNGIVVNLIRALSRDARRGDFEVAKARYRYAGIPLSAMLKYSRPPGRNSQAGTPLTESGDYVIPDWPAMLAELDRHASDKSFTS